MKQFYLPAALLLGLSQHAIAQNDLAADSLRPVVVTADRVARTIDETLAPVTVITRAEIERQQASSVTDLLRGRAGLSISRTGGPGQLTSLFMRGSNSDHTLVLIDGVRVNDASSGGAAWEHLPLEQIERIEIVRGPRTSLYGSEAIGGVVQIFTRRASKKLTPAASLTVGSRNTVETSGSLAGGTDAAWFNIGADVKRTSGINASYTSPDTDLDGYRRQAASLRVGYRFSPHYSIEANALTAAGNYEFDSNAETDFVQHVAGVNFKAAPLASWRSTLSLGQTRHKRDTEAFQSYTDVRRDSGSWQNDIDIADNHLLTVGMDVQRDHLPIHPGYQVSTRRNSALFAQYIGSAGSADWQLALRRDRNEQFGQNNTGSVAVGYALSPQWKMTGSYGRAFAAPTFDDLYYPFGFGNPALRPEHSRTTDLGVAWTNADMKWQLNVFDTRVRDLIVSLAPTFYPMNVGRARIRGVENVFSGRFDNTELQFSYSYTDPRDRSGGVDDGRILINRTQHSARLDLDHKRGAWSFGTSLIAEGKRYANSNNSIKLGGFGLVDVRAEYRFTPAWRVQAKIENVFDKHYETARTYNQPGLGAFVTLRYQGQ